MEAFTEKELARFWAKVQRTGDSDCWLWTGTMNRRGYGNVTVRKVHYGAHRLSFMLHHGPIPEGCFVCHRCDVPSCVNPAHLFAGTPRDNMADAVAKGRSRTMGGVGDARGGRRLSSADVLDIRRRLLIERRIGRVLAKEFGVSEDTIYRIAAGTSWRGAMTQESRRLNSNR